MTFVSVGRGLPFGVVQLGAWAFGQVDYEEGAEQRAKLKLKRELRFPQSLVARCINPTHLREASEWGEMKLAQAEGACLWIFARLGSIPQCVCM